MKHLLRTFILLSLAALPIAGFAQTARTVLIEEFTGDWCGHCPKGADTIHAILGSMPNVRALAYHGGSATEPFQTTEGNALLNKIGLGGYPTAAIDRVIWNIGGTLERCISRSIWRAASVQRSATLSPLSLNVYGKYDPVSRKMTVYVEGNILVDMPGEYNLNVIVSADSLYAPQVFYSPTGTVILDPYYHMHAVQKMVTGSDGKSLTTTGFTSGQVVKDSVTYTIPAGWIKSRLDLTVFIARMTGTSYLDIQQSFQKKLLQALIVLPVSLTSFYAQTEPDGVFLSWTTGSESNNKGWYIERKTESSDWASIAFVEGRGTSGEDNYYSYTDRTVREGDIYAYRLKQIDYDGTTDYSPSILVANDGLPVATELHQNFPNPFNGSTEIGVSLANEEPVTVEVYDAMGRLVKNLSNGTYGPGRLNLTWNGTGTNGAAVPPGAYFYKLSTPTMTATKQMILAR